MIRKIERQAEICADLAKIRSQSVSRTPATEISHEKIIFALEQFMECVRYLNTRRSTGAKLNLEGEDDVQDAIYLMLRPWINDLVYENPTDKIGNRFVIKDFLAKSAKTVVEAKFIRDENHGKYISKELHDDIETYRHHPHCKHLIFFIYDPDSLIPNVAALREEIITSRTYDGEPLYCHIIIRP
jgi:hypothetical protein